MSKFMVASKQATDLDKEKIKLDTRVCKLKGKLRRRARKNTKLIDAAKKLTIEVGLLKNLDKEMRTNIGEKDTRLNHIQKRHDEFSASLGKAKEMAVDELKSFEFFRSCWTNIMQ